MDISHDAVKLDRFFLTRGEREREGLKVPLVTRCSRVAAIDLSREN